MGRIGRRSMGGVEKFWTRENIGQDIPNMYYFKRKMNSKESYENKTYVSHIFVMIEDTQIQLDSEWEYIIQYIAVHYQSKIDSLIERSNFYVCFFINEDIKVQLKEKIEGDTFCAKKYVFSNAGHDISVDQMMHIIEKRIFAISEDNIFLNKANKKKPVYVEQISLENFRCYAGKKQFSFLTSANNAASLVVIYAKNGMGKTSIFDGIEFALKGQVDRIKEMVKRDSKDNKWKGAIYHNREHSQEKASVCINLNNGKQILRNVGSLSEERNDCRMMPVTKGSDIVGNDRELWNQLILPHYKIDNFVSARKPTDQYEEWSKSTASLKTEQKKFIDSHKILVQSEKEQIDLQKKIKTIEESLEKLKEKQNQVFEFQKLILQYNEISEDKLPDFHEGDGPEQYDQLKNEVSSQIYAYKEKRKEQKENKEKLEYIFEVGYDVCVKNKKNAEMLEKNIREIDLQIQRIQERDLLLKQKESIEKQLAEVQPEVLLYSKIKVYGSDSVLKETNEYRKIIENEKIFKTILEKIDKEQKEIEQQQTENAKMVDAISQKKKLYSMANECLQNIKQIKIVYSEEISNDQKYRQELIEISTLIEQENHQLVQLQNVKIPSKMSEWNDQIQLSIQENMEENYFSQVMNIRNHYLQVQDQITILQGVIAEREQAVRELEEILKEGRKYISNHYELCECPLCHTKFATWNELVQKVFQTQGEHLTSSDQKVKKLCDEIQVIETQYQAVYQVGNIILKRKIEEQQKRCLACEQEKINIQNKLRKCGEKQEQMIKQKQLYEKIILNQGIELTSYEDSALIEWKEGLEKELKEKYESGEILRKRSRELKGTMDQYKEKLNMFIDEKDQIMKKAELFKYIQSLIDKPEDFEPERYLNELMGKESELKQGFLELEKKINGYLDVAVFTISQLAKLRDTKRDVLKSREVLRKRFAEYAEYSEAELSKKLEELKELDKRYAQQQSMLQKIKDENGAREYFKKIHEYQDELEKEQIKLEDKKKEVGQQEENFEKAKNILENAMKNYFNQQIINEIYKKINPHEIMREMRYELSFNDNEEPQLVIKTSAGGEKGDSYRPEGYFSTAQLNAVAFSSFLGRALKADSMPIQSIFIDDPVGHFDDINILGFADLIRSILESTNYQIIMSTHDEKVFQILQRKLSKDYYSARFIRLEEEDR